MQKLIQSIVPFIILGVAIVAFAFGVFLLSYLLLFGALVGLVLFIITWIRDKFFSPKMSKKHIKKSSRIIDSDDWKEL